MDFTTTEEWKKLSAAERVAYCRRAALEAEQQAESADGVMAPIYRRLTEQWRQLSAEIERGTASDLP